MGRCHVNQKQVKMQIVCMSLFTKGVQNVHHLHGHSLEILSSLVICSVDNVSRHVSVQIVLSLPR